jgi:uncharacterized protein (TIGR03083 family)
MIEARPEALDRPVPACPDLTVRDLIAHLVRNCVLAEGNLRRGSPRARPLPKGIPVSDLLARWEHSGRLVERRLELGRSGEKSGSVLVMDAFTHELDLARALGIPFPPEHPALPEAFAVAVDGFSAALSWRGLPPLSLESAPLRWNAGDGPPAATVAGAWIDLYRSLVGRRSVPQIRDLDWSAEPRPWLPAFTWGPFRPPSDPVE